MWHRPNNVNILINLLKWLSEENLVIVFSNTILVGYEFGEKYTNFDGIPFIFEHRHLTVILDGEIYISMGDFSADCETQVDSIKHETLKAECGRVVVMNGSCISTIFSHLHLLHSQSG